MRQETIARAHPRSSGVIEVVLLAIVAGAVAGLIGALLSLWLHGVAGVNDRSTLNCLDVVGVSLALWFVAGLMFSWLLRARPFNQAAGALVVAALAVAALFSIAAYADIGPLAPYPQRFPSLAVPVHFIVAVVGVIVLLALVNRPWPVAQAATAAGGAAVVAVVLAVLMFANDSESKPKAFALGSLPPSAAGGSASAAPALAAAARTPAPASPAAGMTGAATPTAAAASGPLHFTVANTSEARYTVREKLAMQPAPSDAIGSTSAITGDLFLTPTGMAANPPSTFQVDLRTLKTDQPRRDQFVRMNTLQSDMYPMATYTITSIDGFPTNYHEGDQVNVTLNGTFNVHNVSKPLQWTGQAHYGGGTLEAVVTTQFDMSDFNIAPPDLGFVKAESGVKLDLHLIATQQPS